MTIPIRDSVKVLLLNEDNELLLIHADDPKTTSADGKSLGRFWFLIGGKIEPGETLEEAAIREVHEETGIREEEIELGPIVWYGQYDLVLSGTLTHLKQTFLIAKTKQKSTTLANLTPEEQEVIQKTAWFTLEEIINSPEVIYPILLPRYLPDILSGNYPEKPLEIKLTTKP